MGEVYKAQDQVLKRYVALKTISPSLVADEQFRKRFHREAESAAQLNHPEHRHRLRVRRGAGPDLPGHGAARGERPQGDHRPPGPEPPGGQAPGDGAGLRGARLRARQGRHPPRPQAREHPRPSQPRGQDPRLRPRPAGRVGDDAHGHGHGDAELHVAGAGARGEGGRALRPVLGGGAVLRAALRPQAVRFGVRPLHPLRGPGARSAAAAELGPRPPAPSPADRGQGSREGSRTGASLRRGQMREAMRSARRAIAAGKAAAELLQPGLDSEATIVGQGFTDDRGAGRSGPGPRSRRSNGRWWRGPPPSTSRPPSVDRSHAPDGAARAHAPPAAVGLARRPRGPGLAPGPRGPGTSRLAAPARAGGARRPVRGAGQASRKGCCATSS